MMKWVSIILTYNNNDVTRNKLTINNIVLFHLMFINYFSKYMKKMMIIAIFFKKFRKNRGGGSIYIENDYCKKLTE